MSTIFVILLIFFQLHANMMLGSQSAWWFDGKNGTKITTSPFSKNKERTDIIWKVYMIELEN